MTDFYGLSDKCQSLFEASLISIHFFCIPKTGRLAPMITNDRIAKDEENMGLAIFDFVDSIRIESAG